MHWRQTAMLPVPSAHIKSGRPACRRNCRPEEWTVSRCAYEALTTKPVLMHAVQTVIFCGRPLRTARTLCRLGLKRRLLTLWAWLTLLPTIGFFPQISHTFAIFLLHVIQNFMPTSNRRVVSRLRTDILFKSDATKNGFFSLFYRLCKELLCLPVFLCGINSGFPMTAPPGPRTGRCI